jgi:hypothetical protein
MTPLKRQTEQGQNQAGMTQDSILIFAEWVVKTLPARTSGQNMSEGKQ